MPDQVRDAFAEVIEGNTTATVKGQTYIENLIAKKRYQEETW